MYDVNTYQFRNKARSLLVRVLPALKNVLHLVLLTIVFITSMDNKVQAQNNINYAIHANIIYRFTKYIDWPASHKGGDFVIGIVGESPLFDELKNFITNKTVGEQRIVIRRITVSSGSFNGHIIFIPENENDKLKKISSITAGTATLIVTESSGSARKGACISLATVNEHLKMEINKNNIEKRKLSIAPEL